MTPSWASVVAIVDSVASSFSSAPPASHTNGITWWTRSNAALPGEPNAYVSLLSTAPELFSFSSVALKESQSSNAVAGSTPAFSSRSLR